jgi:hypothetical protein
MNVTYLTRARRHFNCADQKTNRHNQRAWIRSIRFLGANWLLAQPVTRTTTQ